MSERISMISLGFDAKSNTVFCKNANCRSTFDTLHGNDGRKGSTALSMSTISRATRVLTYRFNEVLPRETLCEPLEMVSPSRRECYFNKFPPRDIPCSGKQMEINAMFIRDNANEILALLYISIPQSGSFVTSRVSRVQLK